ADDFHKAAIPFLDPEVYGRSIYENSSFIASSKNPNAGFHGKGFVARLSGSTVEFIHMWSLMMFGLHPFTIKDGKLTLAFSPLIPSYLIGDEKRIEAAFLGKTKVIYHLEEKKDYIPEQYEVKRMQLCDKAGGRRTVEGGVLLEKDAEAVRSGGIDCIEVTIQ
ncbi:MAG: hypothetical protein NC407_15115, partial [Lachnoclostridium sp.]|nr:hypothetical protein [Lachnoclostridium sp.]